MEQYVCKWAKEGCNQRFCSQSDAEEHNPVCSFALMDCPQDCHTKKFCKRNLVKHMTEECTQRPVECDYCHLEFPHLQIGQHQQRCPYFPVVCRHCTLEVLKKDLQVHLGTCQKRPLPCRMQGFGCDFVGDAEARLHHDNDLAIHFTLFCGTLSSKFQGLSEDIRNNITELKGVCSSLTDRNEKLERQVMDLSDENKTLQANFNDALNMFIEENRNLKIDIKNIHAKQSSDIQALSKLNETITKNPSEVGQSKKLNLESLLSNQTEEYKKITSEINALKSDIKEIAAKQNEIITKETQNLKSKFEEFASKQTKENKNLKSKFEDLANKQTEENKNLESKFEDLAKIQTRENEKIADEMKEMAGKLTNETKDLPTANYLEEIRSLKSKIESFPINYSEENKKYIKEMKELFNNYLKDNKNIAEKIASTSDNCNKIIHIVQAGIAVLIDKMEGIYDATEAQCSKDEFKDILSKNLKAIQNCTENLTESKQITANHSKEIQTLITEIWDMSTNYLRELQGLKKETQNLTTNVKDTSSNYLKVNKDLKHDFQITSAQIRELGVRHSRDIDLLKNVIKDLFTRNLNLIREMRTASITRREEPDIEVAERRILLAFFKNLE